MRPVLMRAGAGSPEVSDVPMAYENLLRSVEESAEEKERELRENTHKQVEVIRREAKKLAAELVEHIVRDAENAAEIERNKQLYLANGSVREQALKSREAVFASAFETAAQRLAVLRQSETYPTVFRNLVEETVGAAGGSGFVIHIDPRDADLCTKTLAALNISCEIRTDLSTLGGLAISSPDGRTLLKNTFESRLERVRELRRREIHAVLFG
ncbi:V-type ATP synthase subunit E [Methanoregula sp.]|uniref:V-type ATP synthase subunit E n=1 Tax=Methanoregula sp. TaxID=2052170 RepID=UPI002BDABCA4|nr:V-type ATP synthase subunit E [Methanoregula sp.]HVP96445.1 V-type ATP synthase subunit E [Methanoregula sp.]